MPGMGWSDIIPGASYTEPVRRRAIVEFGTTLDCKYLTLAGESMGATVSLTAATKLEDRVGRVVAFNTYDYPKGVGRANRIASIYVGSARLPVNRPGGHEDGEQAGPGHCAAGRPVRRAQAAGALPGRAAPGWPPSRVPARGARSLPQCGQHDRRASALRPCHRPRHPDLRRSRLVADAGP